MGFDYAHLQRPCGDPDRHPGAYTPIARPANSRRRARRRHEQLTEVAFIAAKTTRLRLVTSVMVVPHRPAVLTAKMLATIDVLSGGRLTLGIGAGWMKEEFEASARRDFAERGKVTDEYIDAFRELWTNDDPHFAGKHVQFDDIVSSPSRCRSRIRRSGSAARAARRCAVPRAGRRLVSDRHQPGHPLDSLARFKASVARLRKLTAEAGRDPDAVGSRCAARATARVPAKAGDGERRLFSGKPAEIAADIKALRDMGVGHLDFGFGGATVEAMLGEMQQFRKDVLALV